MSCSHLGILTISIVRELELIQKRFLEAYERSDRLNNEDDPDYDHYGFTLKVELDPKGEGSGEPREPRPTHYQARTIALTSKSYRRLIREIHDLLTEAEYERDEPGNGLCTLVFLGMDGALQPGMENSHSISSFVPAVK